MIGNRPAGRRRVVPAALLLVLLVSLAPWAGPAVSADPRPAAPAGEARESGAAEPVRLSSRLLGETVVLEVLDPGGDGEELLRKAFRRLQELARLVESARERLDAEPEDERAVALDPELVPLFERAQEFCHWSDAAVGPLGGALALHWEGVAGNPEPPPVPQALTEAARCRRLAVEGDAGTVRLAGGSRLRLAGFADGFLVDRAVAILQELGAANAHVRMGRVHRAFGAGPPGGDGRGWPVVLPVFEGYDRPLDEIHLQDRSLALIWRADWPEGRPLHVDQRNGLPPEGVWATVAVTELALDAQGVATAALVLGAREGRFRIANLRPEPSVLWVLGRGKGRPLLAELNWPALKEP